MHLLFISSLLPEAEPASGFEIANAAIAAEFVRQGVRLSFAGFRTPGSRLPGPGEIPLGELTIENATAGRGRKARWVLDALRAGLPIGAAKVAALPEAVLRERLAAAGPVDGYILNSIQMAAAYPFLAREKPSIFIAHNVEHRTAAENADNARSLVSRLLYRREARLLRGAEARICRDAAVIHTLSRDDGEALGLAGDPRLEPLALSIGRGAAPAETQPTHDIGLIGTWSWAPNRVGLDWFIETVVPRLAPDVTVAVAGRFDGRPPKAPANVRFLGRVPDAQGFVHASRVIALATRGGTGIQLKTLETFEEGLPAVATRSALRGVRRVPDNVVAADEPADFAEALSTMVAVERAGHSLRRDGRPFALGQREALGAGVRRGLTLLRGATVEGAAGRAAAERPPRSGAAPAPFAPATSNWVAGH